MRSKEQLHALISSLSLSEKRFFRLQSKFHAGTKNYLVLFTAIERLKIYDEERLKVNLKQHHFIRHLAYEKNYLQKQILRSLRNYHSEASVRSEVLGAIKEADILNKKGLFIPCSRVIRRAKEMAIKNEQFGCFLELLSRERTIIHSTMSRQEVKHGLSRIYRENQEALKKISNISEYEKLADNVFFAIAARRGARSRKELTEINALGKHHLLQHEENALSSNAKQFYNYINAEIALQTDNWQRAYLFRKRMIELVENNPEQIRENIFRYVYALNNLAIACRRTGRDEEFLKVIGRMRSIPERFNIKISAEVRSKIFIRSYNLLLNAWLDKGDFSKGAALAAGIEKGINEFKKQYDPVQEKILCYNMAYIYFGAASYKKTLHWLNRLINEMKNTITEDLDCYARILNLITHYELGNDDLLTYAVRTTKRFIQNSNRFYRFETLFLDFMEKKLPPAIETKATYKAFLELRSECERLFRDPLEKKALEYFDFTSWIESKITGLSFEKAGKVKSKIK